MQSKTPPEDREQATDASDSVPSPRTSSVSPKLTPDAWAEVIFPPTATGRLHDDAWQHSAADLLHGWSHSRMITGQSVTLDEATYRAACAAASGNKFTPHPAADFRPKKG